MKRERAVAFVRVDVDVDVERMSVGRMMLAARVTKLKITRARDPRRPMFPRAS